MKIRHFIVFALVIAALALVLSGCGSSELDLEDKTIVTFQLQGGTLNYGTSTVDTYIKYAYEPGTYVLDPVTDFPRYKLTRNGYNFTGWYTSADCKPGEKWDFDKTVISTEPKTLYAGWEKAIVYSYTVYYTEDGKDVALGTYKVSGGDTFEDWKKYASDRKGYTPMGYYSDSELTTAWDYSTKHPGGETDLDIPVYVDYIEGEWKLVYTLDELKSAIGSGENVYLMNDIDCAGASIYFKGTYNGILEGNGHSVKSFKVEKQGGVLIPTCAIFDTLGSDCVIRNLSFTDVDYQLLGLSDKVNTVKMAALAVKSIGKATVKDVTVSGSVTTNHAGELEKINSPIYEASGEETVENFSATVTKVTA